MGGEWPLVNVGKLADSISETHKLGKDHLVFLNTSDVLLGKILHHSYSAVSEWPGQAKKSIRRNDILFSEIRPANGRWAYVDVDADDYVVSTKLMVIRARENRVVPRFLYHFLTSEETTRWLQHLAESRSGTFPQITFDEIAALELALPSPDEQATIAHFLDCISDKIELNRRVNETLEAIARAIFKSWFADFDPVRAKAARRDPGLPNHIANLFPDSFEDSELGEIPKGWAVAELGEITDIIDCLHAKKPESRDIGRPLLQLCNIRDDGLIDMSDTYFIDEADYEIWISRMEASPGDCVITNVGRVGAVAQIPEGVKAALGRNMTGIRCKRIFPFPTFLIQCLLSEAMRNEIVRKMDTGTILDALNVRNIPSLRVTVPHLDLLEMFEESVRPFRARMELDLTHSRTLATFRDTLLPKLISGEIKVKEAERFLKERDL